MTLENWRHFEEVARLILYARVSKPRYRLQLVVAHLKYVHLSKLRAGMRIFIHSAVECEP